MLSISLSSHFFSSSLRYAQLVNLGNFFDRLLVAWHNVRPPSTILDLQYNQIRSPKVIYGKLSIIECRIWKGTSEVTTSNVHSLQMCLALWDYKFVTIVPNTLTLEKRQNVNTTVRCCDTSTSFVGKQRQFRGPENASYWDSPWVEPWRMRNSQMRKKLFQMERASSVCKSLELERAEKSLERSHFNMTAWTELEGWVTKGIS